MKLVKDYAGVAWRFTQTLLRRLPDVADEIPVGVALGLARLILEIKYVCRYILRWIPTEHHTGGDG